MTTLGRAETIARLKVKLADAEAADKQAADRHKRANRGLATKRRKLLESLLALTDDELAETSISRYSGEKNYWPEGGSCPVSVAAKVQKELDILELITDETIKLTNDSMLMRVLRTDYAPEQKVY